MNRFLILGLFIKNFKEKIAYVTLLIVGSGKKMNKMYMLQTPSHLLGHILNTAPISNFIVSKYNIFQKRNACGRIRTTDLSSIVLLPICLL